MGAGPEEEERKVLLTNISMKSLKDGFKVAFVKLDIFKKMHKDGWGGERKRERIYINICISR